ncbi:MAG: cytochrome c oxidase subunit II [Dehalococcoidia bacterium]
MAGPRSRLPRGGVCRHLVLGALLVLLAGCGALLPPEAATEQGREVRGLYGLVLALAAIVFVGVEGFIVYAVLRYRRRRGDDVLPPQHHGNARVEVVWTAIPAAIVVVLFALSTQTLAKIETRAADPLTVEVEAFQWQWTFRYPNGYATTGTIDNPAEMVVPVGRPIRLVMWSVDVIHSFYVPAFLVKRDTLPLTEGQAPNELELTITEPGVYRGQCAEFCGLLHSKMTLTVRAVPEAEWLAWAAQVAPP